MQSYAKHARNMAKLDDVETAFPGLVLADEGLWYAESLSYMDLGQACFVACLA